MPQTITQLLRKLVADDANAFDVQRKAIADQLLAR